METALLLLLSVGTWAQHSTERWGDTSPWPSTSPEAPESSAPPASESPAAPALSSVASSPGLTGDPGHPVPTSPAPMPDTGHTASSPDTPTDHLTSRWTVSLETSTKTPEPSSVFLDVSDTTSDSTVSIATNSPGSQTVADEILATGSLEPAHGASGSGPTITMTTSSPDLSNGTSELPVSMVTNPLTTTQETTGSPTTLVKIPTTTSLRTSVSEDRSSLNSGEGTRSTLLPVLVTVLVVIVLLILLLLWRQRQKQRSGVLMLNGVAKRNGAVDAWAGPAPVTSEEALMVTVADAGGDKDSGVPPSEASGKRPSLTTFFGRRRSCQGSVALKDLGPGAAPELKPEEEALMGADGVVEAPTSDGPEAGNGEPACE